MRRHLARAALLSITLSSPVMAFEPGVLGDEPVRVDVTNASSVLVNFDNRDFKPNQVSTLANDEWGMWYNRLNVQATWGKWHAGLRLDNSWFFRSPDPTEIGLELLDRRELTPGGQADAAYFRSKVSEAGVELSNRYINWIYPAKYYVGLTTRDVELTVGDFYAQLGRGLVLSVRKLDELASDTTVRGARLTGRAGQGDLRLRVTALAGVMNPLRLDESSGRYLAVDHSVTPDVVQIAEAGMPRAIDTDFTAASPSYAPDRIAGAQLELGTKAVKFGSQGSLLLRQPALNQDVVRSAEHTLTASQSVEVPDFDGHGAAYVEVAVQNLDHDQAEPTNLFGHAVYASVSFIEAPVSLLVEGKHYRRFFPLRANVDLARAREFSLVQYSAPPTTEALFVDTEFEGFNTCVTGARAKADVAVGKDEALYAWLGRYYTWAESVANDACEISDASLNHVWDVASGFEISSQHRKSRANVSVGARVDQTDRELVVPGGTTHVYYQENYLRYDVIRWLTGPFSLQFQGWHRRRGQTIGGPGDTWTEGQHLTGVEWSPKFSAAFGVEYSTNPQVPDTYFNGLLAYKFTSDSSLSLFVGQRRGALRCVAGVCRVFPPFEGVRLDATARF